MLRCQLGHEGTEARRELKGVEKREGQRDWTSPNCHAKACGVAMRTGDQSGAEMRVTGVEVKALVGVICPDVPHCISSYSLLTRNGLQKVSSKCCQRKKNAIYTLEPEGMGEAGVGRVGLLSLNYLPKAWSFRASACNST